MEPESSITLSSLHERAEDNIHKSRNLHVSVGDVTISFHSQNVKTPLKHCFRACYISAALVCGTLHPAFRRKLAVLVVRKRSGAAQKHPETSLPMNFLRQDFASMRGGLL